MTNKNKTPHKPFSKPFWKMTGGIVLSFFILFAGIEVVETINSKQLCTDRQNECIGIAPANDNNGFDDRTTPALSVVNNAKLNITNNSTGKSFFIPLKTEREIKSFLEHTPADLEVCAVDTLSSTVANIAGVEVVGCDEACPIPVITSADASVDNAKFTVNFDDSVYENVVLTISGYYGPYGSSGSSVIVSSTNTSPVVRSTYFGSGTWSVQYTADCISGGTSVTSNSFQLTNSTTPPTFTGSGNNSCTEVWWDGTTFDRAGHSYGFFTADKESVVPMTNFFDACGGYYYSNSYSDDNTHEWHKIECVPSGDPFGLDSTTSQYQQPRCNGSCYKYLVNESTSVSGNIRFTDASGTPLAGDSRNTPSYTTIGDPTNWSNTYRYVPVASACE